MADIIQSGHEVEDFGENVSGPSPGGRIVHEEVHVSSGLSSVSSLSSSFSTLSSFWNSIPHYLVEQQWSEMEFSLLNIRAKKSIPQPRDGVLTVSAFTIYFCLNTFLIQFLSHVGMPFTLLLHWGLFGWQAVKNQMFVPPLSKGFSWWRVVYITGFHIEGVLTWVSFVLYIPRMSEMYEEGIHMLEVVVPLICLGIHKCTIALKVALLSPEERYLLYTCEDIELVNRWHHNLNISTGLGGFRPALLAFCTELHLTAARHRIDLSSTVFDVTPPSNHFSASYDTCRQPIDQPFGNCNPTQKAMAITQHWMEVLFGTQDNPNQSMRWRTRCLLTPGCSVAEKSEDDKVCKWKYLGDWVLPEELQPELLSDAPQECARSKQNFSVAPVPVSSGSLLALIRPELFGHI
ncbi:hypothetical protein CYMTET_53315 [Cymbomonas tetramitiformis]|uniref:Uncharacterized protein n=1 Tax=Cymbomonas tetramitiformis TaxID=36881 RepID=A0AAE0BHA8_9CHLO|nr:hypothetical protein CYMTET_53315 [Cymbomonas tetramitiformis]